MANYLAPVANGLGDLIVSLPALQALIKTGEPTYLVTRSPFQEGLEARIAGLAGSIREIDFDTAKRKADDERNQRGQKCLRVHGFDPLINAILPAGMMPARLSV